jgi:hypothetical protein
VAWSSSIFTTYLYKIFLLLCAVSLKNIRARAERQYCYVRVHSINQWRQLDTEITIDNIISLSWLLSCMKCKDFNSSSSKRRN